LIVVTGRAEPGPVHYGALTEVNGKLVHQPGGPKLLELHPAEERETGTG
jgi:hypothetical protein